MCLASGRQGENNPAVANYHVKRAVGQLIKADSTCRVRFVHTLEKRTCPMWDQPK